MSVQNNNSVELPARLAVRKAALVEMDILNSLQLVREMQEPLQFVMFIDDFYAIASEATQQCGGEIIKYIGDSSLSIFEEDQCEAAIESIYKTQAAFPALCEKFGVKPTGIRATVHTGEVVYGEFGPEGQKDVIGKLANELFQTRGRGITITEQVYRKLPNDKRGPWKKTGGQVVYVLKS
jgi:class 3 adenylate cyclase